MQYLGGKTWIAKDIARVIHSREPATARYVEPFLGGGSTFAAIAPYFSKRGASDVHPDLMHMWKAVANGWAPPDEVSSEAYHAARQTTPSALRGFIGFACSFGGKWPIRHEGRASVGWRRTATVWLRRVDDRTRRRRLLRHSVHGNNHIQERLLFRLRSILANGIQLVKRWGQRVCVRAASALRVGIDLVEDATTQGGAVYTGQIVEHLFARVGNA